MITLATAACKMSDNFRPAIEALRDSAHSPWARKEDDNTVPLATTSDIGRIEEAFKVEMAG